MEEKFGLSRRQFVTTTAAGVVGAGLIPGAQTFAMEGKMEEPRNSSSGRRVIIDEVEGNSSMIAVVP